MADVSLSPFLQGLPKSRLVQLGQHFGVSVGEGDAHEAQVERLAASKQIRFPLLLEWMKRDELRRACERIGLSSKERARPVLMARLLEHVGAPDSATPRGILGGRGFDPLTPAVGAIVCVRKRQYLVEGVTAPKEPHEATRVDLVCLDDDAQGHRLSFGQMELAEAEACPDLISIVREKVKPERDQLRENTDGRHRKEHWWQFGRWTPALYAAIAEQWLVEALSIKKKVQDANGSALVRANLRTLRGEAPL